MNQLTTEIIVLSKRDQGEKFWYTEAISREEGKLTFLVRKPSAKSRLIIPDLFDFAEVTINAKGTDGLYFLKEYQLIDRGAAIANHYKNFQWAMRFALGLSRNGQHLSHPADSFSILKKSIQAWMTTQVGEAVYLKALYLFAKVEGFPVKQVWYGGLVGSRKLLADQVLHQPLSQLKSDRQQVELIENLEQWLIRECDFILESSKASR